MSACTIWNDKKTDVSTCCRVYKRQNGACMCACISTIQLIGYLVHATNWRSALLFQFSHRTFYSTTVTNDIQGTTYQRTSSLDEVGICVRAHINSPINRYFLCSCFLRIFICSSNLFVLIFSHREKRRVAKGEEKKQNVVRWNYAIEHISNQHHYIFIDAYQQQHWLGLYQCDEGRKKSWEKKMRLTALRDSDTQIEIPKWYLYKTRWIINLFSFHTFVIIQRSNAHLFAHNYCCCCSRFSELINVPAQYCGRFHYEFIS